MQTDDVIAVIRAAMQRDGGKRTEEDVEIQDHGVVLSITVSKKVETSRVCRTLLSMSANPAMI